MVELFQLIPFPLVILSIVLVIFPTIFTAIVRIRLYNHLVFLNDKVRRLINRGSPGQTPTIIKDLEKRFQRASQNLEEVNTAALVDGIYSQEEFFQVMYNTPFSVTCLHFRSCPLCWGHLHCWYHLHFWGLLHFQVLLNFLGNFHILRCLCF